MNRDWIMDSLGKIDDTVIQRVNAARSAGKNRRIIRRWLSAAACFLLVASLALTAEATNGTVSNLLAPIFGGAQTEIVEKMGIPVGASDSVNGYTLTVDAIIGDRYSVMIAYTLSRDDGQPIPEDIDFRNRGMAGSGYSTRIEIDKDDPSSAHFHSRWQRNEPLLGRIVTVKFTDLILEGIDGEETVVAEGTWELTFALRYPDTTEAVPSDGREITDGGGKRYRVRKILLSPIGIHVDLTFYEPEDPSGIFRDFEMSLIMADGTSFPLEDGGGGGRWTEGDKKADIDYYADFDIPIPKEDIRAIVICGTVFELNEVE